ncbi:hypothetical protein [Stenomitos frigidus]|uniref:hypothetical protein n=1 Tax=Stenomitos frigidus TaxID=1886765 RepID=UPI0011B24E78|nr:hypothetical protein [Stenomitos frigidus]
MEPSVSSVVIPGSASTSPPKTVGISFLQKPMAIAFFSHKPYSETDQLMSSRKCLDCTGFAIERLVNGCLHSEAPRQKKPKGFSRCKGLANK